MRPRDAGSSVTPWPPIWSLVTILMAGGAGVETALYDAAEIGRGPAFRQLQAALSAAQARREAPWATLGVLGRRLGVVELEELEASMTPRR